jgi:hypothetical protein
MERKTLWNLCFERYVRHPPTNESNTCIQRRRAENELLKRSYPSNATTPFTTAVQHSRRLRVETRGRSLAHQPQRTLTSPVALNRRPTGLSSHTHHPKATGQPTRPPCDPDRVLRARRRSTARARTRRHFPLSRSTGYSSRSHKTPSPCLRSDASNVSSRGTVLPPLCLIGG